MNLISPTGVPEKKIGDGLTAMEVNAINNTVNTEASVCNTMMKGFCNVNQEMGNYEKVFTISSAAAYVPEDRRCPGMLIRFLGRNKKYSDYVFTNTDVSRWLEIDCWKASVSVIDGGEW